MRAELRPLLLCLLLATSAACGDRDNEPGAASDTDGAESVADANSSTGAPADGIVVTGFAGPESVLHDARADVYLVSNLNGQGFEEDGNGFISRIDPDGTVRELKWIDGASDGVVLNAPKGMGFRGDTLLVADIDVVRLFDRVTGAPLGRWGIEGASFLNDVAVDQDGTVYVSDTGVRLGASGLEDTGRAAIHVFGPGSDSPRILEAGDVTRVNGLAVRGGRLYGVGYGNGAIFSVVGGVRTDLAPLPGVNLDGVVILDDGSLLISDWTTQVVYELRPNGFAAAVVRNIETPADIGLDTVRNRLLIPGLATGQVLLAPLAD